MRSWVVSVLLLAGCAAATPTQTEVRSQPKRRIPAIARGLLHEGMASHGQDMSDLVWAVLFLDDASVVDIADNIAAQPRLARPVTGDATELGSRLPERFFEMQDQLLVNAKALAAQAREKDWEAMTDGYATLMTTCVRCHAAFLEDAPRRVTLSGE